MERSNICLVKECTRYRLDLLVDAEIPDATRAKLIAALSSAIHDHLPCVDRGVIEISVAQAT